MRKIAGPKLTRTSEDNGISKNTKSKLERALKLIKTRQHRIRCFNCLFLTLKYIYNIDIYKNKLKEYHRIKEYID